MSFIVAIDGPAGSGKGTIAKRIAKLNRFVNIDTGAMYRCVSLQMLKEGIKMEEIEKISEILDNIKIDLINSDDNQNVLLNGEDVTEKIRSKEVTEIVSFVSSIKEVRFKMADLQRALATNQNVVMEGRDIGTCIFPNADVKIYLDANLDERAKRRQKENEEKGFNTTYEEVINNIAIRDENDKNKEIGALKIAKDAIVIDTTNLTLDEVEERVEKVIQEKRINKEQKVSQKPKKQKKNIFKEILRVIIKSFLGALVYIVYWPKKVGENNIPKNKPVIICPNHTNFLDPAVLVLTSKRQLHFMAKEELFKNPILNFLGWVFEMFPVKRNTGDMASMKNSLKYLKNNKILGIYPEGTRNGIAKKVKFKTGAVYLALSTNAVIVPVGIQGNFKLFRKIKLNFGKPMDFSNYKSQKHDKEVLEKITKEVMDEVIRLTNEVI